LNNRPAVLGNRYKPGDTVEVDGSLVTAAKKDKRVYLALNKPAGITTTTELHIKDNIISFIGYPKRIFPIGRLDKDSEGLILLTNDGEFTKLMTKAGHIPKVYHVKIAHKPEERALDRLRRGPYIDKERLAPCEITRIKGSENCRRALLGQPARNVVNAAD